MLFTKNDLNVLVFNHVVLYYSAMKNAELDEIFASIQGEGPWIGQRQIFVRFLGCDLRCKYCDTPAARIAQPDNVKQSSCRYYGKAGSMDFERAPNPLSASELTSWCAKLAVPGLSRPVLSLTGGEPLLQTEFLKAWLPQVKNSYRIYLETCGVHYEAMKKIIDLVDVVSMDFKLPSATGLRPFWDEHRKFLSLSLGKSLYVKAVVTGDTTVEDVATAARLIAGLDRSILFVLQPASGPLAPGPDTLVMFQELALGLIEDVRVIPQAHKMLKVM